MKKNSKAFVPEPSGLLIVRVIVLLKLSSKIVDKFLASTSDKIALTFNEAVIGKSTTRANANLVPNLSIGKKVNVTINPTSIDDNFYIITYAVYSAKHLNYENYHDYQAAIINVTKNNNVEINNVDGAFLTGICKRVLQSDDSTRMLTFNYINAKSSNLPKGPYYYTIKDYDKANIYVYN